MFTKTLSQGTVGVSGGSVWRWVLKQTSYVGVGCKYRDTALTKQGSFVNFEPLGFGGSLAPLF